MVSFQLKYQHGNIETVKISRRFRSVIFPHARHLSAEGVARCEALCQEKNCKLTAKNVEKIALDVSYQALYLY